MKSHRSPFTAEDRANVGRRIVWADEPVGRGTIVGIVAGRGGWVRYRVMWDPGSPSWWGGSISLGSNAWRFDDGDG